MHNQIFRFRVFENSAYSSTNEVHTMLSCTAIEFFITLEVAPHVHVEDIDFYVFFVLLFELNNMLQSVHATEV